MDLGWLTISQFCKTPSFQFYSNTLVSAHLRRLKQQEEKFEALLRLNAARYAKALKAAKFVVKNELGVELGSPLQEDQQHLLEPLKCIASSLFIEASRGMR